MDPVYLYVALLDVLAYRHYLEEDRRSGTLDFQQKLSSALRVFDDVNDAVFRIQAISDTILISCAEHVRFPDFLVLLRQVFLAFLAEGIFVRGGIAYSKHFQSSHLTYSHAVARAYEIESTLADYPRICIDENILKMYETGSDMPVIAGSELICVENGVYFLDVLTGDNWLRVHDAAKAIYNASADMLIRTEAAFSKHQRFERYLLTSRHAPAEVLSYVGQISSF